MHISKQSIPKKKEKFGQLIIKADSLMNIIFGKSCMLYQNFDFLRSWKNVLSSTQLQFYANWTWRMPES